jgi:hypothetical protein
VPSTHAIKTLVNNFEKTSSTLKKKGGSVLWGRTWKCLHCDLWALRMEGILRM